MPSTLAEQVGDDPSKDPELIPYEGTHQDPRGGVVEKPYIGETRMFDSEQIRQAMYMVGRGNKVLKRNVDGDFVPNFLHHHIPLNMRGPYKIDDRYGPELEERVGPGGYALCNGLTRRNSKNPEDWYMCKAKAVNRSGLCAKHGGALCPLDRLRIDWSKAPRHIRFKYGHLSVEELDDEELARGQLRVEGKGWTDNRFVSAEIHKRMTQELFNRADVRLRENLVVAVETAAEIASGKAYDEAVRLKAAQWMYETVRGKTPQKVEIGVDKKFEQVIDAVISGGSREESRKARGVSSELEDAIDAEVVEDGVTEDGLVEDDDLDLPDLPIGQVPETQEDAEEEYDYRDDLDHSVARDLESKPVLHHGPAGKPHYDVPADVEGRQEHWRRHEEHAQESELRKKKIFKKRNRDLSEQAEEAQRIAEERKEHEELKKKMIAKRKAIRNNGYDTFPEPVEYSIEVSDEEGLVEPEVDEDGNIVLEAGDSVIFSFDLEGK